MATDGLGLLNSSAATMWAHLTRKDTNGRQPATMDTVTAGSFLPPTGAFDKTATTMRVLLHDTQMNLERFSGNVERLIQNVQQTEQGIKATNALFESEHDKLMGDIIDLVNRVQKQIQTSIGSPAQSPVISDLFKNVDRRLESLDQRLDAIQSFNQTHSQALQTQMQAIQALQTQQNTIASAVVPLLPLLQSLTPYTHSSSSRVSAVFASPRPSDRRPVDTGTTDSSTRSSRTETSRFLHEGEYRKKRDRSSSDGQASSSPSTGVIARKKSRSEYSSKEGFEGDDKKSESYPSEPLRPISFPNSSAEHRITANGGKTVPLQTPRRPLQEIFRSPRLFITPLSDQQQGHQLRSTSRMSHTSSSKHIPNPKLDKIIRQMSLQRNLSPQNVKRQVPVASQSASVQDRAIPQPSGHRPPPAHFQASMPPPPSTTGQIGLQGSLTTLTHQRPTESGVPSMQSLRPKESIHFKEGKRFIPLIDTDSTDEDDC